MEQTILNERPHQYSRNTDALPAQEIKSKRTQFGKVFSLGGNRFQAVTYAEPIHKENPLTGEWEELDLSFQATQDDAGHNVCMNASGDNLSIACGISGEKPFITLADNSEHKIAWGIEGAASVNPEAEKKGINSSDLTVKSLREEVLEKLHHQIIYSEIFSGVKMICESGNQFKDTFVFATNDAIRPIVYLLSTDGMTARAKDSSEICLLNKDDKPVFYFTAPFLMDADGVSGEVDVKLEKAAEGYRIVYTPDPEFVAKAAYPLILDPAVQTAQETNAIVDTYVREGYTNDYSNATELWITNTPYYGNRISYLKVTSLPTLGSNHFITEASIHVKPAVTHSVTDGIPLLAKEVLGNWDPSLITYANQPSLADVYQDSWLVPPNSNAWCELDITALARKWYMGTNYGVAFVPYTTGNTTIRLQSMNGSSKPYFVVNYSSLAGLEDYLSYDAQPVGRGGTGYVSLHNGNMVFAHSDTVMNGARMPVSVTHYYNSCDADKNDFNMGYGWRTNLHQTLHKELISSKVYYVYTDGDGTEHYFESSNTNNTEYKDMSGLSLKLVPGNPTTITDKGDNVLSFPQISTNPTSSSPVTSRALISSIKNAVGDQITINSTGLKIYSVYDGSGRVTVFDYNNSNMCSGIRTSWQTTNSCTRFSYSNDQLVTVTYEDNKTSTFTYSLIGNYNLLRTVEGPEGKKVTYYYTNTSAVSGLPHYVSYADVKSNSETVTSVQYIYGHLLTEVYDLLSGKSIRYHFNDNGNQISVDDKLGYAQYTRYDQTEANSSAPINHATVRSRMQKVVTNLLSDPLMNDDNGSWTTGGTGTFALDTTTHKWGNKSRKITISANNEAYVRQALTVDPGKAYTLSGYVKSTGPKAFLRVGYVMNYGSTYTEESDPVTVTTSSGDFERIAFSFILPVNATGTIYCYMVCKETAGSAWFDCLQLEEGQTLNHFNMLQNSTFMKASGNKPTSWQSSYNSQFTFASVQNLPSTTSTFLTGRCLRVNGLHYANIDMYQQIRCSGNAGDRFSAGGWCCGYAKKYRDNNTAYCRINVLFSASGSYWYSGGYINWNSTEGNWQFACAGIMAPVNYSYIKFAVEYIRQINYADFTNLFLYPEQFGAEYVYDEKGNSTSVTTLYTKSSNSQYDDFNNLTSYTAPGHTAGSTFNYGSTDAEKKKHLLLKSISPLGTVTTHSYNAYGSPIESIIKDADTANANYIKKVISYSDDGNYITLERDARGKTVTTVTDSDKGTVTSVKDPNNQQVNYTYDTLRRVTEVSTTADSKTYKNEYSYDADTGLLTEVKHNTTSDATSDVVYHFTYDNQGRQEEVKVGTASLSVNTYNTGYINYGTLQKVTYGNGGEVRYQYDNFNRVTGIAFDSDSYSRYYYEYNANGQVACVTDNDLNRIQESEYDLANRPCRVKLHQGGTHVYTGEVEYDPVKGNLSKFTEKVGAGYTKYETTFGYDNEDRPVTLNYGDTNNQTVLTYDQLGRVTNRTVKVGGHSYATSYSYWFGAYDGNSTTALVSSISQSGETFYYTYDDVGNISSVTRNGVLTQYAYDNLGQLIRVNDQNDTTSGTSGTTWVYEYDRGGNILNKKRYAYTTGTLGTPSETIVYGYGDNNWKDLLTHYNYIGVIYDNIGNPISYDSWTFTWEKGRQLKRMYNGYQTLEYSYNADGLRVKKHYTTSYGVDITTNYTLHGKNIVHITQGSDTLHFWYDAQNRPAIVEYNGTKYAYIHNLQGDIVGIIDSNGNEVVKYSYDAWGKVLSTTGSLASTLGTVQPFRYRGYVYDVETGLYYLRSRYYNPEWGKFINADTLVKGNLYRYCHNSPISRIDVSGNSDMISETSGNVTDFMREGFEFLVWRFPRDESNWRTYIQKTKVYYYIPYQDFQYYRNCLDDSHYNARNELLSIIDDEVTSLIDDVGTSIIKMLFPKILGSSFILSLIRDIEAYQKAVNDARVHENMSDAHQKAVDNKSGVTVEITIIKKWIAIESLDWRHYAYYEVPPMLEFDYSEGRNFPIDNF